MNERAGRSEIHLIIPSIHLGSEAAATAATTPIIPIRNAYIRTTFVHAHCVMGLVAFSMAQLDI